MKTYPLVNYWKGLAQGTKYLITKNSKTEKLITKEINIIDIF